MKYTKRKNAQERQENSDVWKSIKRQYKKLTSFWHSPPAHVLNQEKSIKSVLAEDYRFMLLIDLVIWAFLVASIQQMAFVFGRGDPGLFHYLKAVGVDAIIWILSRAISKEFLMSEKLRAVVGSGSGRGRPRKHDFLARNDSGASWMQYVLWIFLTLFLLYATTINIYYEMWDFTSKPGTIALQGYSSAHDAIVKNLSSAFISLIIVSMTFVRLIINKSMTETYNRVEIVVSGDDARERKRERDREYRERRRQANRKRK